MRVIMIGTFFPILVVRYRGLDFLTVIVTGRFFPVAVLVRTPVAIATSVTWISRLPTTAGNGSN